MTSELPDQAFPLMALPPEVILCLATWWTDTRLGLPTETMCRSLSNVLRDTQTIAHRGLRRFGSSNNAIRAETARANRDYQVMKEILRVGSMGRDRDRVVGVSFFKTLARDGDVPLTTLILRNSSIPQKTKDTALALRAASHAGMAATVEVLLRNGANVLARESLALTTAYHFGHQSVVELHLQHGADARAWHARCTYGRVDMIAFLVAHGADVHAKNREALRKRLPILQTWATQPGNRQGAVGARARRGYVCT
ncbi:hypothetical protein M427DRAFT_149980 [Gonapodya prolifera JEL478]|uniref:Uncharacterized protein n=1 Tax=Gonapodya prolifera (strain JEL478) TaxID=1344416 RepID=A0A138ZYD0_GONPJ|nr:hypothetical protein M427DRAFT_149980 [Gonapodya prolifera JEL478]|eukprot:KXS09275.1 hypothetical protein M427DRAFT_149980 [Gonapodya prolifera JEL478]